MENTDTKRYPDNLKLTDNVRKVFALQGLAILLTVGLGIFTYSSYSGAGITTFQILNAVNPITFNFPTLQLGLLYFLVILLTDCFFALWVYAGLRGFSVWFNLKKYSFPNKKLSRKLLIVSIICFAFPFLSILGQHISYVQIKNQTEKNIHGTKCQELSHMNPFPKEELKYYNINCIPYF